MKTPKIKFEKLLEIFHKTLKIDNWGESCKIWEKALIINGWTVDEFDEEMCKRVYGGKSEEIEDKF